MDAEPLAQAATPDADMTIDYDQPLQPAETATDADMGVEAGEPLAAVPSGAEVDVEAEMRVEGDYVPEVEIATDEAVAAEAPTAEAEEVAFEDIPTTESVTTVPADGAATADVSFTTVEEAMASALAPAPVEPTASAAPGALTMPDSAPSATLAPEPSVSSALEVPIPDEVPATEVVEEAPAASQEISAVSDLHTTVGDGGAAARDLEAPAGPAGQPAQADSGQAAADESASAEAPQLSEPAPAAPEEAATATEAPEEGEPASGPVPPLFALATEKLAEQVEEAHSHSHDATEASASNARPAVEKEPLEAVELPADFAPGPSTSSARLAPGVLLTCGGTTYCLFRQLRIASETSSVEEEGGLGGEDEDARGPSDGAEEDAPMILGETSEHVLYYEPVERVLESLRKLLPEVDGEADELVLDFEDLGITLGEDNVYCRQVSLFDFDRLHLGCQIPGRFHVRIYAQPRFASGFNALAQHIASIYAPHEGDDGEEGEMEHGEDEDEAGVADDYDGPDSELPTVSGADDAAEAAQNGPNEAEDRDPGDRRAGEPASGDGGEVDDPDFDLESALAQLDQDNVIAVVEGAQEDLMLAPEQQQQQQQQQQKQDAEADVEGDARAEDEEVEEGELDEAEEGEQAEEGEEAQGSEEAEAENIAGEENGGEDDEQSWQLVDGDEAAEEENGGVATAAESLEHTDPSNAHEAVHDGEEDTARAPEAMEAPPASDQPNPSGPEDAGLEPTGDVVQSTPATAEVVQTNGDAVAGPAETVGDQTDGPKADEAGVDPSDVVIDYDEAFDPSAAAAAEEPSGENAVDSADSGTLANGSDAPASPKRSRSFDEGELPEGAAADLASDAKRPRLASAAASEAATTTA